MGTIIDKEIQSLNTWLDDLGQQKSENDAEFRLAEHKIHIINAKLCLNKIVDSREKTALLREKIELERDRLKLDMIKFYCDMTIKSDKLRGQIKSDIGKVLIGLSSSIDNTVISTMKSIEKTERIIETPQ